MLKIGLFITLSHQLPIKELLHSTADKFFLTFLCESVHTGLLEERVMQRLGCDAQTILSHKFFT
jgi:hypothetical protein